MTLRYLQCTRLVSIGNKKRTFKVQIRFYTHVSSQSVTYVAYMYVHIHTFILFGNCSLTIPLILMFLRECDALVSDHW